MVSSSHKQFFNVIVIDGLHSLDSTSTSVLAAEIIYSHSLDITKFCHSNDSIFPWNQILCGKIIDIISDGSSSLIAIFISDCEDFFPYNTKKEISVCKNCQEFADLLF